MNLLRLQLEGKPLSEPELEVLRAAADGLSAQETADLLVKSHHTITTQRRSVEAKLGARNLSHAVALGFKKKML
jgi:DNA-binding CsgD family transcriptional regulator